MKLISINEENFNKIEGVRQIIVHDHSWRFSRLDLGEIGWYGLSWRSESIEPVIEPLPDGSSLWIGIDEQVVAICLNTGRIGLKFPLFHSFLDFTFCGSTTAVLTELEVYLFSSNFLLGARHDLPEIADEAVAFGDRLVIKLIDGESLTIDTQTGALVSED